MTVGRRSWLAAALSVALVAQVMAEDWPTYMHDPARSGVTGEKLALPMSELWSYAPPAVPKPAWPGANERDKITFDDATHVAMAGDSVYFGSPVDNGIHAVDAATGARRWTVFTDGPVRLAPTVADGCVYAGSDDGAVYCLEAGDGKPLWKSRPLEGATRILGAGRIMSLWPVRTDVVVDGGMAYCGAGLFPARQTTVVALDAKTGQSLWKMHSASPTNKLVPPIPQGYIVASAGELYVPRGRAPAQIVSRRDGAYRGSPEGVEGWKGVVSGDYGILVGSLYYFGTQGRLYGIDASGKRHAIVADTRQMAATPTRLFRLAATKGATSVVAADRALGKSNDTARLWSFARSNLQVIVVAGPNVIVGGDNEVIALDADTGRRVWSAPVGGLARGLAVANGRLVVSTDRGRIHCFGQGAAVARAKPSPEPFAADEATARAAARAESIVKDAGVRRGYALVIGGDGARLAFELARRSSLMVHVVETNEARAASARLALSDAGTYGTRVVVDVVRPGATNGLPYPPYFANIVVVDASALGHEPVTAAAVLRVLKPCGGVLYSGAKAAPESWTRAGTVAAATLTGADGWTKLVRGSLPGAGEWTHQYGDAGNTASSDDDRVKGRMDVLWYGEPGPADMQERHRGSEAPLFVDGRVYTQGLRQPGDRPVLMCFDAYNGTPYWEREMPGAVRLSVLANCGNLAAATSGLFVAVGGVCHHLDPNTGETRRTFTLPAMPAAGTGAWGYVAVVGDTLVGSVSPANQFSRGVFAYAVKSGQLKWRYEGGVIRNSTLAVSGGRVLFAEQRGTTQAPHIATYEEYVRQLQAKRRGLDAETNKPPASASPKPVPSKAASVRTAVGLDLETGKELWAGEVDLTDCGRWAGNLCAAAKHDTLVFYGAYNAYGAAKGDEGGRRALAVSAADGSLLWNRTVGNYVRPVLVNDWFVTRPTALDLRTGEPVTVRDPRLRPWSANRLGACGQMSASSHLLFYRIGSISMTSVETGKSAGAFLGMRPGCLINIIPAGGIVVVPEASSGCVCPHAALQSTVALVPMGAQ